MVVSKLHETALTRLNLLSISMFFNIIKNEVQIHGVRLITRLQELGCPVSHSPPEDVRGRWPVT
jgi:hypothetical protein